MNFKLGESEDEANDPKHEVCYWAKLLKSNEVKRYTHFVYPEYEVIESNQYISIIETRHAYTECATGSVGIKNVYIIDKNSGKLIDSNSIASDGQIASFKAKVKAYFDEHKSEIAVEEKLAKLNNFELCYVFYSKSGNVVITFDNYMDSFISYEYVNGNWVEYKDIKLGY